MIILDKKIPSSHIANRIIISQIVPEQFISNNINIYEDALPYIQCSLRSTIQHEAAHRKDEESRNKDIIDVHRNDVSKYVMPFDDFSAESRVEPIAEQEEEDCQSLMPSVFSDKTLNININDIFESAKNASMIDSQYKKDIKAGTLQPEAQGMYLMQDMSAQIAVEPLSQPNQYKGVDNTLWIDVRKIIDPFIVHGNIDQQIKPPTYQDDGLQQDVPGVSKESPFVSAVPGMPSVPSVPSVEGR